jgi:flagellar hook-associated protein 2
MSLFSNNVSFINNNGFNNLYANPFSHSNSKTSSSNSIFDVISLTYGVNNKKSSFVTSTAVQEYGNSLTAVLTGLTAKGSKSLFNQIGASSSTSTVASATVDNAIFNEAKNSPVNLNVAQMAKAQINSGAAVRTGGKSVNSGNYEFAIGINGKEQKFSIKVDASDDNESIQKKMAEAINSKKIGVTASVTTDSKTNTTKLSLTADETGNENEDGSPVFEVRDTRGNLAEKMGITQISQHAQNAIYSVNGEAKTSTSNSVDLGNGVTATLKSTGQTAFTFQRDGSGSIDTVKELVSTLNNILMEAANTEGRGSDKLGKAVSSMNKAYKGVLNSVGINVSAGGMLSANEDKLKKAAENGSLEKLFQSNGNYGFAYRAQRLGSNMSETNMFANEASVADSSYNYSYKGMNYYNYASAGSLLDSLF